MPDPNAPAPDSAAPMGASDGAASDGAASDGAASSATAPHPVCPNLAEIATAARGESALEAYPEEPQDHEGSVAARRLRHLSAIGLALSAERDIQQLLGLILSAARELTGADGGTLYIVETDRDGGKSLFFRAAQNDSIIIETNLSFAVSPSSLAGYAALTGQMLRFDDVYQLDPDAPFKFNPSFDADHGYCTRSILIVPLQDHLGQVIGVLQLINRKRHRGVRLHDMDTVDREVIPFDEELTELATILASQASVALNNTLLLREIEELFEALVVAASSAIEDRDPTTSGHSRRVTNLTLALARAVDEAPGGAYGDTHFTPAQLKELRYATLLHDFGKIGVREAVLTKSRKIEAPQFEAIQNRILAHRTQIELAGARQSLQIARGDAPQAERDAQIEAIHDQTCARTRQLDGDARLLTQLNNAAFDPCPDTIWDAASAALTRLQHGCYQMDGAAHPLVTTAEAAALRVRRGTLTPEEFMQIQNHAQMSFEFLEQIPWTPALDQVPAIARAHHERLDGSGYPQHLRGDQIPLGARLMAIADVYDALTASDRPYKRALSTSQALEILQKEVAIGKLDGAALQLFMANEIWKLAGE